MRGMHCRLATDCEKLLIDSDTRAAIRENWQRFIARRPTKEIAALCRLIQANGDTLTIATDVTYQDVVGLRWKKQLPADTALFQTVTAQAVVKTTDNHMVLVPRDSGDWEPSLECPGGFIRATHLQNGQMSVTDFIRQRVMDDMHLGLGEISSCTYLTTCDAKNILEYMLIYEIILNLASDELKIRHPSFTIVPPGYTPDTHHEYTTLSLHPPSKDALAMVIRGE